MFGPQPLIMDKSVIYACVNGCMFMKKIKINKRYLKDSLRDRCGHPEYLENGLTVDKNEGQFDLEKRVKFIYFKTKSKNNKRRQIHSSKYK